MSEIDKAVEKIKSEMERDKDDDYIHVIGKFLLQQLEANPKIAEKIVANDKTIAKSIDEMAREARKKAKNNRAMLTDAEGFAIVLRYYGVDVCTGTELANSPDYSAVDGNVGPNPKTKPITEKKVVDFDVRLEDLL
jgi:hypothetical protein